MPSEAPLQPEWHRLHPTSLLFSIGRLARNFLIPGVIVFIAARDSEWELWLMALFLPAVIYYVFHYLTLRYRFDADELVIRRGLIFRNERHIPYRRIHNVDLVQGIFHRAFKVADVKLQTASGREPEATLKVLSLAAVETMRERIFSRKGAKGPAEESQSEAAEGAPGFAPDSRILVRLNPAELIRVGLISGRGIAIVAILIGIAFESNLLDDIDIFESAWEWWQSHQGLIIRVLGLAAVAMAVPLLFTLSIVWAFLRLYDFKLERRGNDLRITCGLLTKRSATIPRHRIQLISIRESFVHRWMGRVAVRIETAAGATHEQDFDDDVAFGQKWFIPLLRKDDLARVLPEIFPRANLLEVEWRGLAPKARRRIIRRNILVALLMTAAVTAFFRPWGALSAAILLPWFIWLAMQEAKRTHYARADHVVIFESGVLTRKRSAAPVEKAQVVSVTENPFDRRWGMASVRIDTAGAGPAGHTLAIPYLARDAATSLASELFHAAEERELRW